MEAHRGIERNEGVRTPWEDRLLAAAPALQYNHSIATEGYSIVRLEDRTTWRHAAPNLA